MEFKALLLFLVVSLLSSHALGTLGIAKGNHGVPLRILAMTFAYQPTDETAAGYFHWSAAVRFSDDEATVIGQLPSLARQGYEEMLADVERLGIAARNVPAVMAALAVTTDNIVDVYFSSSLKSRNSFLINPTLDGNDYIQEGVAQEVGTAIFRCQQTYKTEHRFNMQCAEPLAIQQYLVNNKGTSIVGKGKVSTYGLLASDPTNLGIKNPCPVSRLHNNRHITAANASIVQIEDGQWGCEIFLEKIQVAKVGQAGTNPELPSIQPVKSLPHCFWTT